MTVLYPSLKKMGHNMTTLYPKNFKKRESQHDHIISKFKNDWESQHGRVISKINWESQHDRVISKFKKTWKLYLNFKKNGSHNMTTLYPNFKKWESQHDCVIFKLRKKMGITT